jgi:hypothetical protein
MVEPAKIIPLASFAMILMLGVVVWNGTALERSPLGKPDKGSPLGKPDKGNQPKPSPWAYPEPRLTAKGRVAVVTSITGGYDAQPPRPAGAKDSSMVFHFLSQLFSSSGSMINHPNVSFFLFTDRMIDTQWGWQCITRSYHLEDSESDVGSTNSFSKIKKQNTWNNMQAKYYNYLAWRVPELLDFQYIVFVGGDVILEHATNLYTSTLGLLQGNYTLAVQTHPTCRNVRCEADLASGQPRYRGFVSRQVEEYLSKGFPDAGVPAHYWAMAYVYDSHSYLQRQLLWRIFQEVQIWSLDDQIALPYVLWQLRMEGNVHVLPHPKLCLQYLQNPSGQCRAGHSTRSYGSA